MQKWETPAWLNRQAIKEAREHNRPFTWVDTRKRDKVHNAVAHNA